MVPVYAELTIKARQFGIYEKELPIMIYAHDFDGSKTNALYGGVMSMAAHMQVNERQSFFGDLRTKFGLHRQEGHLTFLTENDNPLLCLQERQEG